MTVHHTTVLYSATILWLNYFTHYAVCKKHFQLNSFVLKLFIPLYPDKHMRHYILFNCENIRSTLRGVVSM